MTWPLALLLAVAAALVALAAGTPSDTPVALVGTAAPADRAADQAVVRSARTAARKKESLPPTELLGGDGPAEPMKNQAKIVVSDWGLRFIAGQQNSRITLTMVGANRIRYEDRGTQRWKSLHRSCKEKPAAKGIAAVCRIPRKFRDQESMFLEIWPRLGDDRLDARQMPARFRVWMLADAGRDVARFGPGDDFFNAAQDDDKGWMGAGDDWARGGKGDNVLRGGPGDDKLIGQEFSDVLRGGPGNDVLRGAAADDVLVAGSGYDIVDCGPSGGDQAVAESTDKIRKCESVRLTDVAEPEPDPEPTTPVDPSPATDPDPTDPTELPATRH
ncbi:MAG: hypothetical protein CMH83_09320 [Nocardioides sp.]|nr:hypothetical protein [Nocardioides sp.]